MKACLRSTRTVITSQYSARTSGAPPRTRAAYLLPHLTPDAKVLDVGCGPGTITAGLADRVPRGHVTGIDAAQGIIEQARAAAGGPGEPGLRRRRRLRARLPGRQLRRGPRPPGAAAPERPGPGADRDAPGNQARRPVAVRDGDYGAFTWYPELPVLEEWRGLYMTVARATAASRTAGATCTPGPGRRASPTSPARRPTGPTPRRPNGPGGAACGPTARSSRRTRPPRSAAATPRSGPGADRRRLARLGRRPGRLDPRARTARSSAGSLAAPRSPPTAAGPRGPGPSLTCGHRPNAVAQGPGQGRASHLARCRR